jgi:rare lipoprotein A
MTRIVVFALALLALGGTAMAQCGVASWYGYTGARTANGERFDGSGMTAAHRSLPFGTRVRVTDRASGHAVTVRINDRGPFVRGRIIDLSREAGAAFGIWPSRGVANVCIEVIP